MSKRFTKEELEHDPLLDFYVKSSNFYERNKMAVLSAVAAIVIIIAGTIGYTLYSANQEARAQDLLAVAEANYSQGDFQTALDGDEYTLSYGFVQIANDFSGTDAGNIANYYAAVSSFKLGNIEDALAYIREFKPANGVMGVGAISFYASLLEANGSDELAAQKYEEAAAWDENPTTTPYNLYQAAEIYYNTGNMDKAGALVERIIEEYPESVEYVKSQRLQGKIAVS